MALKLCKTGAAFEAFSPKKSSFNLLDLVKEFESAGYTIVVQLPEMIIVRRDCEMTIYRSGRILLKTEDEGLAERASRDAYSVMGAANE